MITRKQDRGLPGNGGEFATPIKSEPDLHLQLRELAADESLDQDFVEVLHHAGLRGTLQPYDGDNPDISDAAIVFKHPRSDTELVIDPKNDEGFAVLYEDRYDEANSFRTTSDEYPSPKEMGDMVQDMLFTQGVNNAVYSATMPDRFEIRDTGIHADGEGNIHTRIIICDDQDELGGFGYLGYDYTTGEASLSDCDNPDLTLEEVITDLFPEGTSAQQGFDKILQMSAASPFVHGALRKALIGVDMDNPDDVPADGRLREIAFDAAGGSWTKTSDMNDLNHDYRSTVGGIDVKVRDDYLGAIVQYEVWDNREPGVSRQLSSDHGQDLQEVMAVARAKRAAAFHYGTNTGIHEGDRLPFGISAGSERTLPGVDYVWAKGGLAAFKLTENRNADVHPVWRNKDGFYNEKIAWVIPTLTHHGEYAYERVAKALEIAKKEYGPQLATAIRTDPKRYGALSDW
ncbi:DUF7007 domain-containing protein [Arthrobacter sp. A2-55]|uniref:DUF7007 domain-containing protein n=1 Tax=Arthrobacter sp. A2-55 TaxID=2897337 RepID=UPI0021CD9307|nr:hypothetical protein [Arthrobacter sp. A2-55]MCU6480179.1 hypothetical protein [Arthrobacter sp. A2-55]